MRIITWNLHRATAASAAWDLLAKHKPDIALLQEVSSIPEKIRKLYQIKEKKALTSHAGLQKFSTVVLIKGKIIGELPLFSKLNWVNKELKLFEGNLVSCVAKIQGYPALNIISAHCPAWPIEADRLKGIDISQLSDKKGQVWATEILQEALENAKPFNKTLWIVGGDYNCSETFDADWQDKNGKRFGIREYGSACKEILDATKNLGFKECLREYNGVITPTFKHSSKLVAHQIDHLFVTERLFSKLKNCSVGDQSVIFKEPLSDHLPIIASFKQWK